MRTRVRGIYATALTRVLLDAGREVVGASDPIRRRFDAEFGGGVADVTVVTTDDRQGVGVDGERAAVDAVVDDLAAVGIDALAWPAQAATGGVFDGRVTETLGRGAVVDLGVTEGYLPFDAVADHVSSGDALRIRVAAASPPWVDERPELDGSIAAARGPATLVRGASGVTVAGRDDAAARELVGMTDLFDVDVPEGWGIRWKRAAVDAEMDALRGALESAAGRARTLVDDLADPVDPPAQVATQGATTWVWFGAASRRTLDERRRAVAATMPGHHRTKAASAAASAGVDLAEALCDPDPDSEFPFDVVTRQFGPVEGDTVAIAHGKPDGRVIVLGRGEVVERDPDGTLAVRREMTAGGHYDGLDVPREAGDVALTKVREGRWWYPTVYRDADGDPRGTYVNVCTPVECFPDAVRYVDLHVDVVRHADGRVERVDDDELDAAVEAGVVPPPLAEKARSVAASLESAL